MVAPSNPVIEGPIGQVPYEILAEIFMLCLPIHPLDNKQPDITIAPMLLCHVCSHWRMVALSNPDLWPHLRFDLRIANLDPNMPPVVAKNHWQYEFLAWWRSNHGSRAPFLNLGVVYRPLGDQEEWVEALGMTSLLNYITSAQYLHLASSYWRLISCWIGCHYIIEFPRLHTLLKSEWLPFDPFFSLLVHQPCALLQHLSINGSTVPYHFEVPAFWETLTHISLVETIIKDYMWYALIRHLQYLQWGNLHFDIVKGIKSGWYMVEEYVHAHLHTLFFAFKELAPAAEFSLTLLFASLHLPALRSLSLSPADLDYEPWNDTRGVADLYAVLACAPNVTMLALGSGFLSLCDPDYNPSARDLTSFWTHVPHLTHLDLTLKTGRNPTKAEAAEVLEIFCQNAFFSDNAWLDLVAALCPIRKITIAHQGYRLNDLSDLKIWDIPRNRIKAPNVDFEFYQVSPNTWARSEEIVAKAQKEWA